MSRAFESIRQGLLEAAEHAGGRSREVKMHRPRPIDVKAVRRKLGMSQTAFAAAFGISLGTLRHWERGDRTPRGPALVLLNVVECEPEAVLRTLAAPA